MVKSELSGQDKYEYYSEDKTEMSYILYWRLYELCLIGCSGYCITDESFL